MGRFAGAVPSRLQGEAVLTLVCGCNTRATMRYRLRVVGRRLQAELVRVRALQIEHATGSAIARRRTLHLPSQAYLLRTAAPRIACGYLGRNRLRGLAQPAAVMPTVGAATA